MERGNTIGSRIEALRQEKGLTQAALAKQMSVKRETIVQWESNSRDLKTAATVKLADFFNVTCDYILRGIEAENVDVHKQLGLSDAAINALHQMNQHPDVGGDPNIINVINILLEEMLVQIHTKRLQTDGYALLAITEFLEFEKINKGSDKQVNIDEAFRGINMDPDRVIQLTNQAIENAILGELSESLRYIRQKYY